MIIIQEGGDLDITFSLFSGDFGLIWRVTVMMMMTIVTAQVRLHSHRWMNHLTWRLSQIPKSLSAEDGIPQEATYVAVTGRNSH